MLGVGRLLKNTQIIQQINGNINVNNYNSNTKYNNNINNNFGILTQQH